MFTLRSRIVVACAAITPAIAGAQIIVQADPAKPAPAHGAIVMPETRSMGQPIGQPSNDERRGESLKYSNPVDSRRARGAAGSGNARFKEELAQCNRISEIDSRQSCVNGMHAARAEGLYRD
jgi:hypothetical protein